MRPSDPIISFVRDALLSGRNRDDIRSALTDAGWSVAETNGALAAFADVSLMPPVPRPRPYVSARDFFQYGLMFVALGVVAWHLTELSFVMIDRLLDTSEIIRYRLSSVRWSMASLIVFFPLFVWLDRRAETALRRDPGRQRSAVRKWFGYVTLFLASLASLGALTTAIYSLLDGELALAFGLKCLVVALVSGTILLYFRRDAVEDADAH